LSAVRITDTIRHLFHQRRRISHRDDGDDELAGTLRSR
jgi:hypothetical protein